MASGKAKITDCPGATLGAPQITFLISEPVLTLQIVSLSASGCFVVSNTFAVMKLLYLFEKSVICSTSIPNIVKTFSSSLIL